MNTPSCRKSNDWQALWKWFSKVDRCFYRSSSLDGDEYRLLEEWFNESNVDDSQTNEKNSPVKASFVNHPCTRWVMESLSNYRWLSVHGLALAREYTRRCPHARERVIDGVSSYKSPTNITDKGLTKFAQAMPEQYKNESAVSASCVLHNENTALQRDKSTYPWMVERMNILVTGGAGYIGSHVVYDLLNGDTMSSWLIATKRGLVSILEEVVLKKKTQSLLYWHRG